MRPSGLTAVCVIGLCLALIGMLSVAGGCLGLIFQSTIQNLAVQMQQGMPGGQAEMFKEMEALQARWMPYTIANVSLNGITSVLLFIGSILGLRMSPRTRQWFVPGLICGSLQALLYTVLQVLIQHDTQAMVAKQMAQAMQQGGRAAPGMGAAMSASMKMGSAFAIAFAGGWALMQIVFYVTAAWYLWRKDVRNLFNPPALDELAAEPTVGGMS